MIRTSAAALLALAALSSAARADDPVRPAGQAAPLVKPAGAMVFVGDGGGLDPDTLRALRAIAGDELRKQGLAVTPDPRFDGVHPAGPETESLLAAAAGRAFSLRVAGRLGAKIPLTLEELARSGAVLSSASLTAGSIEECDLVIPRIAQSVSNWLARYSW